MVQSIKNKRIAGSNATDTKPAEYANDTPTADSESADPLPADYNGDTLAEKTSAIGKKLS